MKIFKRSLFSRATQVDAMCLTKLNMSPGRREFVVHPTTNIHIAHQSKTNHILQVIFRLDLVGVHCSRYLDGIHMVIVEVNLLVTRITNWFTLSHYLCHTMGHRTLRCYRLVWDSQNHFVNSCLYDSHVKLPADLSFQFVGDE